MIQLNDRFKKWLINRSFKKIVVQFKLTVKYMQSEIWEKIKNESG